MFVVNILQIMLIVSTCIEGYNDFEDGLGCILIIEGCTDQDACNYDVSLVMQILMMVHVYMQSNTTTVMELVYPMLILMGYVMN